MWREQTFRLSQTTSTNDTKLKINQYINKTWHTVHCKRWRYIRSDILTVYNNWKADQRTTNLHFQVRVVNDGKIFRIFVTHDMVFGIFSHKFQFNFQWGNPNFELSPTHPTPPNPSSLQHLGHVGETQKHSPNFYLLYKPPLNPTFTLSLETITLIIFH